MADGFLRRSISRGSINRRSQARAGKHESLRRHPMPSRTIEQSHRPRVSNRTMCCHSSSEQLSGLVVFYENDWRRHDQEMEAQTSRNRGTRTRNRISGLGKTTRGGRVHVQTVGLNAETKMERHRAAGEIFLLTFLFIGLRWLCRKSGNEKVPYENPQQKPCGNQ